jgi:hypothetical protein
VKFLSGCTIKLCAGIFKILIKMNVNKEKFSLIFPLKIESTPQLSITKSSFMTNQKLISKKPKCII